jgi:hypothetical protein
MNSRDLDKKDTKRGVINFNTLNNEIPALKFVCYLFPIEWLKANIILENQHNTKI